MIKATIKLSGKVIIRLADNVPMMNATNRGLEMLYSSMTEKALGRLFTETKVQWDQGTGQNQDPGAVLQRTGARAWRVFQNCGTES